MNRHGARRVFLPQAASLGALFALISAFSTPVSRANAQDSRAPRAAIDHGEPRPVSVRSVEILHEEEPIYAEASSASARRGTAAEGARLPVLALQNGPGCRGRWLLVGSEAFVCEDGVRASDALPPRADAPVSLTPDGLPYRYYFVSSDGSFGYDALETAEEGVPQSQLQPGFGVAVRRIGEKSSGDPFGLTTHGYWVPLRDLRAVEPTAFQGNSWSASLAWVRRERAPLFTSSGARSSAAPLARLTAVRVLERRSRGSARFVRVGDDVWLREDDVVAPSESAPPPEVQPDERWIDVDLSRQTLVAYVGATPIFATLVSTGRGSTGSDTATPTGSYRLWVKLRAHDMDNLEHLDAPQSYAIEAVPWVMFFHQGYGLHGTFWHDRFGEVKSHGCINLAPRDAERLFHWTSPRLLPGWTAVLSTPHEPGTLVRIRAK
jgi:hypothetical protein